MGAAPATAATVGYVRLAHLSPDTPAVDVYLSSVAGAIEPKKFDAVGYGVISQYLQLPPGAYAVSMRTVGAAADSPPILTTQANVEAGKAYTVAGVGRYADLGLRVLTDDLSQPPPGKARCRVIHASVRAPVLDISIAGGRTLASGVQFATTTDYWAVEPGKWTLQLQPVGSGSPTTVDLSLAANGVYSVLVVDGKVSGLSAEVRTDAVGMTPPTGGVATGGGGLAPREPAPVGPGLAALALIGTVLIGYSVRRARARQLISGP